MGLVTAMMFSMAGCSGGSNEDNKTETGEDMPNLVVTYAYNEVPRDIDEVEDAINEITKEEIGCTVTFEAFTYGNINDQLTLMLSSPSEQLDVMLGRFYNTGIATYVQRGQLRGLNDLLDEYGQDIKEVLGEKYLDAASLDGEVYGLTTVRNLANQFCVMFRKDIIDELDIDLSGVHTYEDLTPVFAQIHEAYPELYILAGAGPQTTPYSSVYKDADLLGDSLGVLIDNQTPVISNFYESEEFRDLVELMKEWNEAGYIYPDICTDSTTSGIQLVQNGIGAALFQSYKPGGLTETENTIGNAYELVEAPLDNALSVTNSVQSWMWAIPTNSVYPEKAMQFLNLLYSNKDLVNLLCYGIEGEHYVVGDDGFATDGPETAGYSDKASWKAGNANLAYLWEGQPADLYEQLDVFNSEAPMSSAMGFVMDTSDVASEYTALQAVKDKYELMLTWGFENDVDASIDEFNQALYDAGLQKYMDEKQSQLDAFLADQ